MSTPGSRYRSVVRTTRFSTCQPAMPTKRRSSCSSMYAFSPNCAMTSSAVKLRARSAEPIQKRGNGGCILWLAPLDAQAAIQVWVVGLIGRQGTGRARALPGLLNLPPQIVVRCRCCVLPRLAAAILSVCGPWAVDTLLCLLAAHAALLSSSRST